MLPAENMRTNLRKEEPAWTADNDVIVAVVLRRMFCCAVS